ncbi:MAG: hypothetical protein C4K48_09330 [Candidatus Thorarchaeota archaeon]|nr:MAG: hypothetical protein C4K48_09330 [Candidatus Thorarchaeota archaeon]
MNDRNRIPDKRPILFELFCPNCGGSLYAIGEEELYVGRSEHSSSSAGFTITKLECVLCRNEFSIDGIGLKYEKSIADELGWPFVEPIPDGPSVIPEHVEERMRKREQEPDPQGDFIEDFYADHHNRSPTSLEKEVLRNVLKRRGRLVEDEAPLEVIAVPNSEGSHNAQITGISMRFGFSRKWLSKAVRVSDCSEGEIIESSLKADDESILRHYFIVYGKMFRPIATMRK